MEKERAVYECLYCDSKFVAEGVRDLRHHDCLEALAADKRLGRKVARFEPALPEIGDRNKRTGG
jgi:hypothetical protein